MHIELQYNNSAHSYTHNTNYNEERFTKRIKIKDINGGHIRGPPLGICIAAPASSLMPVLILNFYARNLHFEGDTLIRFSPMMGQKVGCVYALRDFLMQAYPEFALLLEP